MLPQFIGGNAASTYPVEPVAAGHKVALQFMSNSVRFERHLSGTTPEVEDADIFRGVVDSATRGQMGVCEVLLNLRLPVDGDMFSREPRNVDAVNVSVESDSESAMPQALSI
jgi:hypothetical protein